jgi:hypothetical protein
MTTGPDSVPIESDPIEVRPSLAIEAQTRGEVDVQIATARRYPRSVRTFIDDALAMATLDEETEFCIQRLRQPSDVVEAMIAGIEVLGEEVPVPAELAEKVGRLAKWGFGPGRGHKKRDSNATSFGRGTEYRLARLERDRPDLAAKVRAGTLKAFTATRQAGWIKTKTPLEHLQHWWRKATPSDRATFRTWLETP